MELYPKATPKHDGRWGSQILPDDYVPVGLDSASAAATRMIAAIDAGKEKRSSVIAAGLSGSDEVGTVSDVLDEIVAERDAWTAVSPADHTTVTKFKAALVGKYLDATTWYNALKAKHGVSTYSELRAACTPAVVGM